MLHTFSASGEAWTGDGVGDGAGVSISTGKLPPIKRPIKDREGGGGRKGVSNVYEIKTGTSDKGLTGTALLSLSVCLSVLDRENGVEARRRQLYLSQPETVNFEL